MAPGGHGRGGGSKTPMTAVSRLKQDFVRIKRDPVPYIVAEPLPSNILEWHYVVTGKKTLPLSNAGALYSTTSRFLVS